jgi:hypothetical protein
LPRLIVLAGVAAGLGLVPAAGGANELIRPGKGIGRVELGMSEAQVRRALGTPQAVIRRRVGFGRLSVEWQFDGGAWRVRLLGRRGSLRVTSVATMARRERTREGFGVGTQERTLRRRYGRALRCDPLRSDGGYVWGSANVRNCSLRGPGGARFVWTSASQRETGDITRVAEWLREACVIEVAVVAAGA